MSLQVILAIANPESSSLLALKALLEQDGLVSLVTVAPQEVCQNSLSSLLHTHLPDLVLLEVADIEALLNHPTCQQEQPSAVSVNDLCGWIRESSVLEPRPVLVLRCAPQAAEAAFSATDPTVEPEKTLPEKTLEDQRIDYFVSGADDIVSTELSEDELRVRLLAHLRRNLDLLSHSVTQLPNQAVMSRILERKLRPPLALEGQDPSQEVEPPVWAWFLMELQGFEEYRETYGQLPAEHALRSVAIMLSHVLRAPDWAGQTGPAQFAVLTHPDRAEKLASILCRQFDSLVPAWYAERDQNRGYMVVQEAHVTRRVNLMRLTVGVASSQHWGQTAWGPPTVTSVCNEARRLLALAGKHLFSTSPAEHQPLLPASQWVSQRLQLTGGTPTNPQADASIEASKKPRLLVVESDAAMAFLLQATLEMQGFEVESVSSAEEALAVVKGSQPPCVVLMDALLNGEPQGWALCGALKKWAQEARQELKVVFVSTLHEREQAMACGADLYFAKPFDLMQLLSWLSKLVA